MSALSEGMDAMTFAARKLFQGLENTSANFPIIGNFSGALVLAALLYAGPAANAATYYAAASRPDDSGDGQSWATAKKTIQAAVDLTTAADTVWVTNGVYNTGARVTPGAALSNRVVITNAIVVQSVNGPAQTFIVGAGPLDNSAVRCVFMTAGTLSGFTLTNGHTRWSGEWEDLHGGGAYAPGAALSNCVLTGNSSARNGGGAAYGVLNNCALNGNSAGWRGGGAEYGTLRNCIVYYNTAPDGSNYPGGTFSYSCTAPHPGGTGNITSEPMFVNRAGGNYRLAAGSPCINAGNNANAPMPHDLDGIPRIVGPNVDMGAYEYPYTPAGIHYAWLQQYGLPIDGSADTIHSDDDGMVNWEEYIAGTVPTSGASVFKFERLGGSGGILTWSSSSGRLYAVEYGTNLPAGAFTMLGVASNLPATPPENTFTNDAVVSPSLFYRVKVRRE